MRKMVTLLWLLAMLAVGTQAGAQYSPIPNYTSTSAGQQMRTAINNRFSGASAISPQLVALPYASLPSEQDGDILWCRDCARVTPCSSGGGGAWAFGARGQWACGDAPLEADLNANGHNVSGALSLQTTGGSVETKNTGDTNWRELLTPGAGVQVSDGTVAPFTVVDENANVIGNVNGVINVKAPPYLAKGDGTTDDTAAIQAAIDAACASWTESNGQGNVPEVYLPATKAGLSYYITSPILLDCGHIRFEGAGWQQTQITQNYLGPTIIAQAAETGWKPPYTASVTAAWQASHTYIYGADILDPNGNIEVEEYGYPSSSTATCTSASTHPTWPTTQGDTVTDNTCVWVVATIGTQIASGSGTSLDAADPEFFNGAGYGSNNATVEIMNPASLESRLNGLSAFTVEFYVEPFYDDGGNDYNFNLLGIHHSAPEDSNVSALGFEIGGSSCTGGSNCLGASADIGGSSVSIGYSGADDRLAINKIHHVALTYDGTTLRLFIGGNLAASASASGNWTIPLYESFELADQGRNVYPGTGGGIYPLLPAFYDSLRISNIARYTSNFTPPTAKFTDDSNTVFLENFPTGTSAGTIEGYNHSAGKNVFIPIETSNGDAELNPVQIGNMSLSDNGIYANWMINSTIENISNGETAPRTCIFLHDNDYQDTIRRAFCSVTPAASTSVGFVLGSQSNNNLYDHLQCDGQPTCIEEYGGSGTYILPDFTDRGYAVYPLAFIQAQALLDSPTTDVEDSAPNFLADIYSNGAYAPIVINGGQLTSGSSAGAYFAVDTGAPIIDTGTGFSGSVAELLNVISAPSSPVTVSNAVIPSSTTLTNSGESYWLVANAPAQDLGMVFADLPTCTTPLAGTSRWLTDGTVGNPCTGSGPGAWADCVHGIWICGD